jgi:hypothetical protein
VLEINPRNADARHNLAVAYELQRQRTPPGR